MGTITAPAPSSVLFEGDGRWDQARTAFNLSVDQRPAAIALPENERQVIDAVTFAREHGLEIAPQATGHGAGALGSLRRSLLVNLSRLDSVALDADHRLVRAGGGARWADVTPLLVRAGLAALHGSSPHVGVVGYSLAGGIGWLARKHGLQANSVTAIELVTAEGHLVRADQNHEPELFWALRGGGGSFGIVTAIEFAVQPVTELYAGGLFFGFDRAYELLTVWAEQAASFPDELTSWATLLHLSDAPHLPCELRGRSVAAVLGAFLGDRATGEELLAPLRELGPELDTFAAAAPSALGDLAMDPPAPVPYLSDHLLLGELPKGAIDDIVDAAGPASGLGKLQLRHTGGALERRAPGAGAVATLPGSFSALALGVVEDEESEASVAASLSHVRARLRPLSVGEYAGFVDHPVDPSRFFDPATWRRLREVKALYDSSDLFRGAHHVPPAEPGARSHVRDRARLTVDPPAPTPRVLGSEHSAIVRPVDDFRWGPKVVLFEGRWDGIEASVYVTTFERGEGPRLHTHPYPEVFLVQEGRARFTAGSRQHDVPAGHFVVVAARTPHRYENLSQEPLTVVSFHPSGVVEQTNLHREGEESEVA